MAAPRRRNKIGHRRRVEDEGDDEFDLDDDSLTDGSLASDDNDLADDSDTSNIDEASPTSPAMRRSNARASNGNKNGNAKSGIAASKASVSSTEKPAKAAVSDTEFMLNGLSISEPAAEPVKEMNFDDVVESQAPRTSAPIVVSSSSAAMDQVRGTPNDRRRREHDEYRRKRDEDPSFVPNRGAFFMHDHRHAGPAANGFQPFGRGVRGRGRGGGGIGGPFAPINHQMHNSTDPTTNAPWTHDMHETVVAEPVHVRQPRYTVVSDGPPNGDGFIPTCPPSSTPINRTLSTEKHIGNVQVRVYIPPLKDPIIFSGMPVKQYTKLPDHRPPLRRDKPVRISLPDYPPRFIFPAIDRSFIFIPRAMRPNQQRLRGKPRSGLGSIGGYSRRTSVFGGSYYNGSTYSPSVALSRRSSIAPEMGRDYIVSPTGSAFSRPPLPADAARPVVRLPPRAEPQFPTVDGALGERPLAVGQSTINGLPQPQTHPLPQKPAFQENRSVPIPMHQPRPQKTVSVENIESPTRQHNSQSYQQAFHHQVPVQVSNGLGAESHTRNLSHPSQHSTGTPLPQIPESAIHAAPFQPTHPHFPQPGGYYPSYPVMNPPQQYYFPPPIPYTAAPPAFVPGVQQGQPLADVNRSGGQAGPNSNLVAQEVNGMVYYYDASQLPPMPNYPPYSGPPGYPGPGGVMNMNGMVTPSPDGFYYPQPGTGVGYYPQ